PLHDALRSRAAHAIADDGHLQAVLLERVDGCLHVHDHRVPSELAADGTAALDIGLLIAHLDAALDAVEERGGQGDEAVGGEAVGDRKSTRLDAEDLLDDDESAAGL